MSYAHTITVDRPSAATVHATTTVVQAAESNVMSSLSASSAVAEFVAAETTPEPQR